MRRGCRAWLAAAARGSRPSFGSGGAADCFPPQSAAQPADQSAAGAARLASGGGLRLQRELFEDAQGSRSLEDAADCGDAASSVVWQTAVQFDAFERWFSHVLQPCHCAC